MFVVVYWMILEQDLTGEESCQKIELSWSVLPMKHQKVPTFGTLFTIQEDVGTAPIS